MPAKTLEQFLADNDYQKVEVRVPHDGELYIEEGLAAGFFAVKRQVRRWNNFVQIPQMLWKRLVIKPAAVRELREFGFSDEVLELYRKIQCTPSNFS